MNLRFSVVTTLLLDSVVQCSSLQACLILGNLVPDASSESSKEMVAIIAGKLLYEAIVGRGIFH